jgi:hypothetical protein
MRKRDTLYVALFQKLQSIIGNATIQNISVLTHMHLYHTTANIGQEQNDMFVIDVLIETLSCIPTGCR